MSPWLFIRVTDKLYRIPSCLGQFAAFIGIHYLISEELADMFLPFSTKIKHLKSSGLVDTVIEQEISVVQVRHLSIALEFDHVQQYCGERSYSDSQIRIIQILPFYNGLLEYFHMRLKLASA